MLLAAHIQAALPVALFAIMLALGMTLTAGDFRRVVAAPRAFVFGLAAQLLTLPLLAMAVVMTFDLSPEMAVGLMVLGFCPSGTTSNLFSHLARADVALSICLTAAASLITPFTIPVLTAASLSWLLGTAREVEFPVMGTMFRLAAVTLVPTVSGMVWRHLAPEPCQRWQGWVQGLALALFVAVITAVIVQLWHRLPGLLGDAGLACLAMLAGAMTLGYAVARLLRLGVAEVKTVTIELGLQNAGLALLVTQGVLQSFAMSVVPVMYGLLMLIPVLVLVGLARRAR